MNSSLYILAAIQRLAGWLEVLYMVRNTLL